ncbi:hypothetical protein HMPREF9380_2035 [Streptococcus sanguinis SK49]|uniref:Uncharacterized protein n=1 Tax=Streptococcus sanguinis SK49 TaxID=888808 RepID=F3UZU5_STRSA|nr:hypothetical protein HMPREF9380_2035 [Streptococcus sanguinis SK49]
MIAIKTSFIFSLRQLFGKSILKRWLLILKEFLNTSQRHNTVHKYFL